VVGAVAREPTGGGEIVVPADLVVDASGRGSKAASWLEAIGYPSPDELVMNAFWRYSSCFMQASPDYAPDFEGIAGPPRGPADPGPLRARAGGAFLIDGDRRWIVSALGVGSDHPPREPDAFRDFLKCLDVPELTQFIDSATFLTMPKTWSATANKFRRFDLLDSFPERLVVLGDAVATLNPAYGQGMSLAMWAARDLGAELETQRAKEPSGELHGLSARFQQRLADTLSFPWALSVHSDSAIEGAQSNFTLETIVDREYMRRLEALSMTDTDVARMFVETGHLIRTPEWMTEPALREQIAARWDELGKVEPSPIR
jgi:2-polyprenyl-6-methoxyphenol hydroxylase-like FAD-dependent oxidoreductase